MQARGQIAIGQERIFLSIIGSRFSGRVASLTRAGPHSAITATVSGRAYYAGKAEFIVEEDDPLCGRISCPLSSNTPVLRILIRFQAVH